jgi:hypothetical protein
MTHRQGHQTANMPQDSCGIGALNDLSLIVKGTAGTRVSMIMTGIAYG